MDLMLDTNVVLDHVGSREGFSQVARKVCLLGISKEANIYVSASMITDLFYILEKDYGSSAAQKMIDDNLSFLQLVSIAPEDVRQALSHKWPDFENCLVAQCAEKIKADYIVTRDEKDYRDSAVSAISPQGLFDLLEDQGFTYEEIEI